MHGQTTLKSTIFKLNLKMEVTCLSKTPLNNYQIDITSQKIRVVISVTFDSSIFPLKGHLIKRFSTSHKLFVFLKVFREVDVFSVYNIEPWLLTFR